MIILQCIKDKSKLRIRFYCYIDNEKKMFTNVYNNNYNCKFPKDIRENGRFYKVNDEDISLINDYTRAPFYNINKKNIEILSQDEISLLGIDSNGLNTKIDIATLKIYDVNECVVCLTNQTSVIFIPCAHRCVCMECYKMMAKIKDKCCLCRREINQVIEN